MHLQDDCHHILNNVSMGSLKVSGLSNIRFLHSGYSVGCDQIPICDHATSHAKISITDFGTLKNYKSALFQSNSSTGTPPQSEWEKPKFRLPQSINEVDEPTGKFWCTQWSALGKFLHSKKKKEEICYTPLYICTDAHP